MSAVERARGVFAWCRAHPKGTEQELLEYLFGGADTVEHFKECRWVKLTYGNYHSAEWSEEFWLTNEQWELLEDQTLRLEEIDGKHSYVTISDWSELSVEQIEDPYEIAARIGVLPIDENLSAVERKAAIEANEEIIIRACLNDDSICGQIVERQERRRKHFFDVKYMRKLLDKYFPKAVTKPNTALKREEGEFADAKLQKLMERSANEMEQKDLPDGMHVHWQRSFIEFLDTTFGGDRSAILDEDLPWYER
jgi:hypothetical protein